MTKELLFSVTANDCEWSYTKGTGAGGQKRNKTSSAVHCMHRPSGARGYSEGSRSQRENKESAFAKMAASKEFTNWLHTETMRRNGTLEIARRKVEEMMSPPNIKTEVKIDGKWIVVPVSELT